MPDTTTLRLALDAQDELESLRSMLLQAVGRVIEVVPEGDRPLSTPVVQLLLAARSSTLNGCSLHLVSTSTRLLSSLRLLGVHDQLVLEN
jgi:hypothetical protein